MRRQTGSLGLQEAIDVGQTYAVFGVLDIKYKASNVGIDNSCLVRPYT